MTYTYGQSQLLSVFRTIELIMKMQNEISEELTRARRERSKKTGLPRKRDKRSIAPKKRLQHYINDLSKKIKSSTSQIQELENKAANQEDYWKDALAYREVSRLNTLRERKRSLIGKKAAATQKLNKFQEEEVAKQSFQQTNPIGQLLNKSRPSSQLLLEQVRLRHQEELALLENQQTSIVEGFVYIMTNPAWPDAIKIGSAIDYERRLETYQTGDPYRAYKLLHTHYSSHRERLEKMIHTKLDEHRLEGEWFKCSVETAVEMIAQLSSPPG
jgi:hypothetical protein